MTSALPRSPWLVSLFGLMLCAACSRESAPAASAAGPAAPAPPGAASSPAASLHASATSNGSTDSPPSASPASQRVYIGTYTTGWSCQDTPCSSKGIYGSNLDLSSGQLSPAKLVAESVNPSYLVTSKDGKNLYAVNEVGDFGGQKSGAVSSFSIDAKGALRPLGQQSSLGADPCHLALGPSGKGILVANYSGGSVSSFLRQDGGALGPGSAVQHHGSSIHANQTAPHAHFIAPGPNGKIYAADLGTDQVLAYNLDSSFKLKPAKPPVAQVAPGGGPRHLAFHPTGSYLYANSELSSEVNVVNISNMKVQQRITTLPQGYQGENSTAEIQLTADGRFLYVSNRGHNSLAVFAVSKDGSVLSHVQHIATGGNWPRAFEIVQESPWLIVANKKSDRLVVFRIDDATGKLSPTGHSLKIPQPSSLAFTRPATKP